MFNPSIANAETDDHTVRKCAGFARIWGYGSLAVVNLFAVRSSNPRAVNSEAAPVGPDNDAYIIPALASCLNNQHALGCGSHMKGPRKERPREVLGLIRRRLLHLKVSCLGYSADGNPRHPLMLSYITPRESFELR